MDSDDFHEFKKMLVSWVRYLDLMINTHSVHYDTIRILSPTEQACLSDEAQQLFYQRIEQGNLDSHTTERALLACTLEDLEEEETIDAPLLGAMLDVGTLNPEIPISLLLPAAHQAIKDQTEQKVIH